MAIIGFLGLASTQESEELTRDCAENDKRKFKLTNGRVFYYSNNFCHLF